jgi:hypothetical protein
MCYGWLVVDVWVQSECWILIKDFDELSMKFLCLLLKTVAQHLEEINEELSRYLNIIEESVFNSKFKI